MVSKKRRLLYKKSIKKRIERKTPESKRLKLYEETYKKSKQVNNRLRSLERRYTKGTWATKKLFNRLDSEVLKAITSSGRVRVDKDLTLTQYKLIVKAMNQFLDSKTSTKRGINEVKRETINSLKKSLATEDTEFTDADAEFAYDMLSDKDFQFFVDKIGASTLWAIIEDAIDAGDTQDGFLNRLELYITIEDLDIREKAIKLYNRYVI